MNTIEPLLLLRRKLERYCELGAEERQALSESAGAVQAYAANDVVVREGEHSPGVAVMVSGFACRYKTLPNGNRQIIGLFLPGDMCDARVFIMKRMDHTIAALGPAKVAHLSRAAVLQATADYPRLSRAFWWNALVEEAITREWLVSIGQRTAEERIAHLFCELHVRLQAVGLATAEGYELPLIQAQLADATALSVVHVNRTIKELRQKGLLSIDRRVVTIHDMAGLRSLAMFDENYLNPISERPSVDEPLGFTPLQASGATS